MLTTTRCPGLHLAAQGAHQPQHSSETGTQVATSRPSRAPRGAAPATWAPAHGPALSCPHSVCCWLCVRSTDFCRGRREEGRHASGAQSPGSFLRAGWCRHHGGRHPRTGRVEAEQPQQERQPVSLGLLAPPHPQHVLLGRTLGVQRPDRSVCVFCVLCGRQVA